MHRCLLLALLAALLPRPAAAQAVPDTDVFLMALPQRHDEPRVGPVTNLTARPGYDNQPAFTPEGDLLYTAQHDGQTDLYRVDLATGRHHQVTSTPTSEYSPLPVPGRDDLAAVVVEADGTQRLWRFSPDGLVATVVFEDLRPVGYHAWADDHTVALFVLGEPHALVVADTQTGRADTVAHDIGRSLHRVPGARAVSFVRKASPEAWTIERLDLDTGLDTGRRTTLAPTLPGREDYAWTPGGDLLMADGTALYVFDAGDDAWTLLADLSASGVADVTRLAVSPRGDLLAFVAVPVE